MPDFSNKTFFLLFAVGYLFPVSSYSEGSYSALEIPYQVRSLGMGGVGIADERGLDATAVNPALIWRDGQSLLLSVIRYPADIQSEAVEFRYPWGSRVVAISLKHLGYGIFEERDDDGVRTGQFSAGDTWLSASIARNLLPRHSSGAVRPTLHIGATGGLLFSQIGNVNATVALFTAGAVLKLSAFDAQVGISVRNFGVTIEHYTDYKEPIPTSFNLGVSKKLAHLPLELCVDGTWWRGEERGVVRIGGEFTLPRRIFLRWGTSSYRFDQTTRVLWQNFVTGSSAGLGYEAGNLTIDLGINYAGAGGVIAGVGVSTRL